MGLGWRECVCWGDGAVHHRRKTRHTKTTKGAEAKEEKSRSKREEELGP